MNLTISYAEKSFTASLGAGDTLALYAVPADYSEDGLYQALWAQGELEPLPACDGVGFLLKLSLESSQGGLETLREIHKAEGVTYAEN